MRAIVWVSVRPACVNERPPSVDLKMPTPGIDARNRFASPVPTQTISGFDFATAMSPMLVLASRSKIARHVAPRSSEAQTPLVAKAA